MTTQLLIEKAMALPLEERIGLAEALWQSISEGLPAGDEREAIEQAARRDAELTSGTAAGRTHEEVMQAARRALGCG
jgi:putative addiction module component (TIGR02574 family)